MLAEPYKRCILMVKVAINGFGRIGRMVFRIAHGRDDMDVVAINDLTDAATLAHLLKRDSAQGTFDATVSHKEGALVVDGKEYPIFAEKDPAALPWEKLGVEIVAECTGRFRTKETAGKHIEAGAKRVVLSAPGKGIDNTIVLGVNEHEYKPETDIIVSNASCTTNCLAPVVKVLDDNFKIKRGFMTTVHAYTADQRLQDAPHKDLRRARAAALNIVPTTTGAAKAVGEVLPHLKGKLDGIAIRVPVITGSATDLVCEVEKTATAEEINALFKNVAGNHMKGVLEYSEEPLVSSDIIHNPHSSIFDSQMTAVMEGNMIKVLSWYDNEWGYSNRMVDLMALMSKSL